MLKKILSYGFVEGIAKGLNKLVLLLLPFFLDTVSFGKVGLLVSLETLLPIITLLGFERAILRFYSFKTDIKCFDKTINVSVNLSHLACLILLLVLYLTGVKSLFSLDIFPDLLLLLVLVYFQSNNLLILNRLRVNEEHKKYFKSRLVLQIGKFVFAIALVYLMESYLGYLVGGIITTFLVNIFYKVKSLKQEKETFEKSTFKYLFAFSWPFIFHGIAINLLGNADKFVLERYLSLAEVGQYTFVYSIGSMIVFGFVGISVYLEPLIYKADQVKKEKYLKDYLIYGNSIFLVFFFIILFVSHYVIDLFYATNYTEVAYLIPLIAVAFVLYPYYLVANYRMIYDKKTKLIAVFSILSCFLNIGLNILLIPIIGLYASVLVTFISYFVQALMFTLVATKKLTMDSIEISVLGLVLICLMTMKLDLYYYVILLMSYTGYLYLVKRKKV